MFETYYLLHETPFALILFLFIFFKSIFPKGVGSFQRQKDQKLNKEALISGKMSSKNRVK